MGRSEGKKRYATDVILEETYFADSKKDSGGSTNTGNNAGDDMDFTHIDISEDDALPF